MVEDALNCVFALNNYGVLINDYWRCLAYIILCAVVFVFCELLPSEYLANNNKLVWAPLFALFAFSIINISNILQEYFWGDAKQGDKYVLLINIFGIIAYIAWLYFERSELRAKNKKLYYLIISAILAAVISTGGYLSNSHMPIKIIRSLRRDAKIQTEVHNLQAILSNSNVIYKDTEEVMKNVGAAQSDPLKSGMIKYKKVTDKEFSLSWNLETDFESISENSRLRKISRCFGGFHKSKQGVNEKIFKLNERKSK
ncbi:MAG: hypothetical protein LBP31_02505 [Holosporales bacterium]|nr:hypothetical protein [Holosporales bacterium]